MIYSYKLFDTLKAKTYFAIPNSRGGVIYVVFLIAFASTSGIFG